MKKSKKILLIVLGVFALAGIIGAVCIGMKIGPTVNHAVHISELLQPLTDAENQTMHISVSAEVNDRSISLDADVYMVTEENVQYLALEQNGMTVYIADHILLLENGRAFTLGEKMQAQTVSYQELLPHIGALYDALKITAEETAAGTAYSVTVDADQVDTLLAAASLGEALPVDDIRKLDLHITEKAGKLDEIRFSGSGKGDGTEAELDVTMSGFRILASGDYPIPDAVKSSVATVDPNELFSLTEDLYRLVRALMPLADMENIGGTLELCVDCGLLQLDTEMKLSDLKASASGQVDPQQLQALPEMIGLLCMEGDISCTRKGDAYSYTLELGEDAMQQLSRMILPELSQYADQLTEGSVKIVLEAEAITAMEIAIEGNISALIARIPIGVRAAFFFEYP